MPSFAYDATFQGWMHIYCFYIALVTTMYFVPIVLSLWRKEGNPPLWMMAMCVFGIFYIPASPFCFLLMLAELPNYAPWEAVIVCSLYTLLTWSLVAKALLPRLFEASTH